MKYLSPPDHCGDDVGLRSPTPITEFIYVQRNSFTYCLLAEL